MINKSLTLRAEDLCSKYGFHDGDLLSNFTLDMEIDLRGLGEHEVLIYLVKKHLLPAIPFPVLVKEIVCCHNPIRVTFSPEQLQEREDTDLWDEISDKLWAANIRVQISTSQLEQAIEEMVLAMKEGSAKVSQ